MKKILSIALCIVLTVVALTALSVNIFAEEAETPAASDVTLEGFQNKNGGWDVRIVGQIANETSYTEVGFLLTSGEKTVSHRATQMFKTLGAADDKGNTYTALTAGEGNRLFALTITGINQADTKTLSVKPYAKNASGDTIYGKETTLIKKADAQFDHLHTAVHHAAIPVGYATAGAVEHWSCEGCAQVFLDAACTKKTTDAVTIPAQKDDTAFENSEANPYLLTNEADYLAFAAAVNGGDDMSGKYVKLTADIGTEAVPITVAIGAENTSRFAGNLDGNGKTVTVNLASSSANAVGAISYLNGGSVRNLTVKGQVAYTNTTSSDHSTVGGVIGTVTINGALVTVSNCHNYATIITTDGCSAGGIVGKNNGKVIISDCTNHGEIKGQKLAASHGVGGIIGWINQSGTEITGCTNYGTVSSTGTSGTTGGTGGIVGISAMSNATISSCTNEGAVSSYRFVGGILGRITASATLTSVTNKGEISGTRDLGGILGGSDSTTAFDLNITGATNNGAVTGSNNYIGGIIGYVNASGSVLTDCTNTGNITGAQGVGGIIGLVNTSKTATVDGATVKDCTISGTGSVGGVIGRIVGKAVVTYKNYTAPTGVTYTVSGTAATAIAGFVTTDRTAATYTTPGEAFGSCAGTATEETAA